MSTRTELVVVVITSLLSLLFGVSATPITVRYAAIIG